MESQPTDEGHPLITLHPHGELAVHFGRTSRRIKLAIERGMTIRQLLARIGVREGEVWVCARNGVLAEPNDTLEGGDVLEIFSPVAGGGCQSRCRLS
ncbi:MAG TPA: MoaD/ThiS family protein [Chloroflexota bacterium]|nr:MoaD/ThiS family protein [Chloroflexota bacterium]